MPLYFAFAEDLLTVDYFLHFQDIRKGPRNMKKPERDFLVRGQVAQSKSQNAYS